MEASQKAMDAVDRSDLMILLPGGPFWTQHDSGV